MTPVVVIPARGGNELLNQWISRPLFQTRLYHPALAGTPPEEGNWNLGGLFPTPLYHGSAELAERPASMQVWIPACAGMTKCGPAETALQNQWLTSLILAAHPCAVRNL